MGSTKTVLPDKKFSGEEDIREFLRDFEIYVAVSDEKAGQFLGSISDERCKGFLPSTARIGTQQLQGTFWCVKGKVRRGPCIAKVQESL